MSLYDVLGVAKTASRSEIRKAYRRAALTHHPDRNQGDRRAEERFKEATRAYQVLGDDEKRARYDEDLAYDPYAAAVDEPPRPSPAASSTATSSPASPAGVAWRPSAANASPNAAGGSAASPPPPTRPAGGERRGGGLVRGWDPAAWRPSRENVSPNAPRYRDDE